MSFVPEELINLFENENSLEDNQKDLIEKDLILHKILMNLSSNKEFKENYAFKGGTCLTKAYFGYYRFSENLDFSFIKQQKFKGMSKNKIRKEISKELEKIIKVINKFCKENNLNFEDNKSNEEYFEFRAGNKFTTIKIYYNSSIDNTKRFIKIQFNFLEKILFNLEERETENLVWKGKGFKEGFNLPEGFEWVLKSPVLKVYSLEEILSEKIRAILTRGGVKERDFIDIYKITSGDINKFRKIKKEIIVKTTFMLNYKRYYENLLAHQKEIPEYSGGEEKLMIEKLPEGFYSFLPELKEFLKEIIPKIINKD